MNTKTKIRTLMQVVGMDLYTLARRIHVSSRKMSRVMMGELEPDSDLVDRVKLFIEEVDLCPECVSRMRHYGGCAQCSCGWGRCE
jgi:hypothetical protein